MSLINPGSGPVEGATVEAAAAALDEFVQELGEREISVEAVRRADLDVDGRFGWLMRTEAGDVQLLMPGVAADVLREVGPTSTPCLVVGANFWWWSDAVGQVAGAAAGKR